MCGTGPKTHVRQRNATTYLMLVCLAVWRAWGPLSALTWLCAVVFAPWPQRGMKDLYCFKPTVYHHAQWDAMEKLVDEVETEIFNLEEKEIQTSVIGELAAANGVPMMEIIREASSYPHWAVPSAR